MGVGLPPAEETPIVVVDDEPSVLGLLRKVLEAEGFLVNAFESAREALDRIKLGDVALLVTDILMPDMTGMELIRLGLEEDPNLAIVVLTGAADADTAVESLRLGVDDYLEKPISVDALVESVGRALRRRSQADYRNKLESWLRAEVERRTEEVKQHSQLLEAVSVATLMSLVRAMEAKDPYLRGHSQRVSTLCEKLAQHMAFHQRDIDDLRTAGLLHDIGMIAIPDSITHKEGQLTEEEYQRVREHVEVGVGILEPLPHVGQVVSLVRKHHERLDGSGYPQGLRGAEISLAAQVVGLAEHYASLTETRPHRPAFSTDKALETLNGKENVWFEARVVDALRQVVSKDPEFLEL